MTIFKFQSGVEVEIMPVPSDLFVDVRRSQPQLKADADAQAQQMWNVQLGNAYQRACFFFGTHLELNEKQLAEVEAQRQKYAPVGIELDPVDKLVYLTKIAACGRADEAQRLLEAIVLLTQSDRSNEATKPVLLSSVA